MHIKFLSKGKGSGRSAEVYLLQSHDHKGDVRPVVEVIYGNPRQVTELIDSLDFVHKYRSAVIAWHPDDKPAAEQKQEVLDEFIAVAHAGLDPNQFACYAVDHGDHIHVIFARVELLSRKSMNIAPPGWQSTYDLIRDKYNVKYQWARPDVITRSRVINQQTQPYLSSDHAKVKKQLNELVSQRISEGVVTTAQEVENYLNSLEGVTVKPRRSAKTLSVMVEGIKKPIRLKGTAYGREFDTKKFVEELGAAEQRRSRESEADREREVERIESVIEKVVGERAEYARSRYGRKTHQLEKAPIQDQKADLQRTEAGIEADRGRSLEPSADVKPSQAQLLDSTSYSWAITDDRAFGWALGIRRFDFRPQPSTQTTKRANRERKRDEESVRQSRHDRERLQKWDRAKEGATNVAVEHGNVDDTVWRVDYDAVRARVKQRIEDTERAFQERAREGYEPIRSQLTNHRQSVSEYHRRAEKNHRESERIIQDQVAATEQSTITELRSNATVIDKQVSTLARVARGIRGWLEKVGKSIQGVKNELEKLKLFNKAKEQAVSRERPKVSLSPRR